MKLIKCGSEHIEAVAAMYSRVVEQLEKTVNYPQWSKDYPCRESVKAAVSNGWQYAYIEENGTVLGALVLNDNPNGYYEAGDWSRQLSRGEYLVIHTLAVDPDAGRRGVGRYMVDCCIELAVCKGYSAIRLDVVPDNIPAINLYKGKGFTYAGTKDLLRNIDGIPLFSLYELNFD